MGIRFKDKNVEIMDARVIDKPRNNFFVQLTKPISILRDNRTYKKNDYHFHQRNNYYSQQQQEQQEISKKGIISSFFGMVYNLIKGIFLFSFNLGKFTIFHISEGRRIYMNVRTKEARIESLRKSHQDENNEIF